MNCNKCDERETILDTAKKIIYGDREQTYGHPSKNLRRIAEFWNVYLNGKERPDPFGNFVDELDVAYLMVLVKVARLINQPDHEDSLVDICGYAALVERCLEPLDKDDIQF